MALRESTERTQLKILTTPGLVPTIPSGATNPEDHTVDYNLPTGWQVPDIYLGELCYNSNDNKLYTRSNTGIEQIHFSGQTEEFIELGDTPLTYSTYSGYGVAVNSGETGLEFVQLVNNLIDLNDTPSTIEDGKYLRGTSGGTVEWVDVNTSFTDLDETPSTIETGYLYGNATTSALTYVDLSALYVTLSTVQSITGIKTFDDTTIFNDLTTFNNGIDVIGSIRLSGDTEDITITDISNDSGLTTFSNTQLATTEAIFYYVNSLIVGSGVTSFVTLDTVQDINGYKTFTTGVTFEESVIFNDDVTINNLIVDNINQSITSYHYYGEESVDGSYRTFINPLGYLETQKRITGTWTFMSQI